VTARIWAIHYNYGRLCMAEWRPVNLDRQCDAGMWRSMQHYLFA
jgi:hypothetical protein